jgi:hypothetical protein
LKTFGEQLPLAFVEMNFIYYKKKLKMLLAPFTANVKLIARFKMIRIATSLAKPLTNVQLKNKNKQPLNLA